MDKRVEPLIKAWQKRNISGYHVKDKESARRMILEFIPPEASVGFSGSLTLNQIQIIEFLEKRGNFLFNQYKKGISQEESFDMRQRSVGADFYLASANAVACSGELVFFSAFGNRTCGISQAKNVIIVCGSNKITDSFQEALIRARQYSTPPNCKRLNWPTPCLPDGKCRKEICLFPEYKRMCCQVLIIEAEISPGRMKAILVDENLGF